MHKENLKRLITVIEKSESFSMHSANWSGSSNERAWGNHPCGTPACIQGLSRSLSKRAVSGFIGLPFSKETRITMPETEYANYMAKPGDKNYITKEHAIRMLKNLLTTGEIDWERTKNPQKFDMKHFLEKLKVEAVEESKEILIPQS